jgi:hypothetical protein
MIRISCFLLLITSLLMAEGDDKKEEKGGDQFRKTAEQYEAKAQKYYEMSIYTKKLADIKRKAAELADAGKWDEIKWDEYNRIREIIAALHSHEKNADEGKKEEWNDKKEGDQEKRKAWMEKKREREWRERQRERRQAN